MVKNLKKKGTPQSGYRIYAQYVLVGAAIGLYYGLFNRNTMEPDYGMAVILSVLAGLVTTAVMSLRKRKTFRNIFFDFIKTTAMFTAFLMALQIKPVLEEIGGRILVITFMTSLGAIFGLILGSRRKQARH
jgi:hypothetical protein